MVAQQLEMCLNHELNSFDFGRLASVQRHQLPPHTTQIQNMSTEEDDRLRREEWYLRPPANALPRLMGEPEPWLLQQWVQTIDRHISAPVTSLTQRAWDIGPLFHTWMREAAHKPCVNGWFLLGRILVYLVGSPVAQCNLPPRDREFLLHVEAEFRAFTVNLNAQNPFVDHHSIAMLARLMLAYEMLYLWRELRPAPSLPMLPLPPRA